MKTPRASSSRRRASRPSHVRRPTLERLLDEAEIGGVAQMLADDDPERAAELASEAVELAVNERPELLVIAGWVALAARRARVACESLTPPAGPLVAIKALRTFDERIRIAGARRNVMTRAVRVRVAVAVPQFPLPIAIDQTFHAIAVAGQWKWILSADQYAYYSEETCPSE